MMAALGSVNRILDTYVSPMAGPVKAYDVGVSLFCVAIITKYGLDRPTGDLETTPALKFYINDVLCTVNVLVYARRVNLLNGALCCAIPMLVLNGLAYAKYTLKYPLNDRVAKLAEVSWNYSGILNPILHTSLEIYELRNRPKLAPFALLGAVVTWMACSSSDKTSDMLRYINGLGNAILFYTDDKYTKAIIATHYVFQYLFKACPQMFTT